MEGNREGIEVAAYAVFPVFSEPEIGRNVAFGALIDTYMWVRCRTEIDEDETVPLSNQDVFRFDIVMEDRTVSVVIHILVQRRYGVQELLCSAHKPLQIRPDSFVNLVAKALRGHPVKSDIVTAIAPLVVCIDTNKTWVMCRSRKALLFNDSLQRHIAVEQFETYLTATRSHRPIDLCLGARAHERFYTVEARLSPLRQTGISLENDRRRWFLIVLELRENCACRSNSIGRVLTHKSEYEVNNTYRNIALLEFVAVASHEFPIRALKVG